MKYKSARNSIDRILGMLRQMQSDIQSD